VHSITKVFIMPSPISQIVQCMRPGCRFRYPVTVDQPVRAHCPKCAGPTRIVESPYTGLKVEADDRITVTTPVEALLDNIRSTFNVGAMMRTADGAGVRHLHFCGITPTPDHPKVSKTALGAEYAVPWTQHWDAVAAATACQEDGMRLWALEGGSSAVPLFEAIPDLSSDPILLIVGNEVSGVDPGLLDLCERRIAIPMLGVKDSLNVSIAFGIAVYILRFGNRIRKYE
jgi:23S rRNA (guanosine2251-2'-O)-methyltransferase